jgi:hypothetical protein
LQFFYYRIDPKAHFCSHDNIRNIEVPDRHFSKSPSASPQRRARPPTSQNVDVELLKPERRLPSATRSSQRPRSPTHPNYKEEEYQVSIS